MPRPCRCRRVCAEPAVAAFGPYPEGLPAGEPVLLLVEEYEALRIIDYEKRTHEQCAAQMLVSRTTVTEIYERARFKLAQALVEGRPLRIEGGAYAVCAGECAATCAGRCRWKLRALADAARRAKGEFIMKIAIPVKNDAVFQHFGMAPAFKVYSVEDGRIASAEVIEAPGQGHGAKLAALADAGVTCVVCGGIGPGACSALAAAGIQLIAGISGSADEAAAACAAHALESNPEAAAAHHHGHGCGCGCGEEGGCSCEAESSHAHDGCGCGCGSHAH